MCTRSLVKVAKTIMIIGVFGLIWYIRRRDLLLSFLGLLFEITKVSEAIIFLLLIYDWGCNLLFFLWEFSETIIYFWLCGSMRSKSSSKHVINGGHWFLSHRCCIRLRKDSHIIIVIILYLCFGNDGSIEVTKSIIVIHYLWFWNLCYSLRRYLWCLFFHTWCL